ncbi:cysteine desulfurase [Candidatus Woesearchaeota archaeon]|nr:cysteine desulfurase [Candidatus Woesearchaeota archaeon]
MNPEQIRKDFPVLSKGIIYLDNACQTLRPIQVIEKINEYYNEYPACGGRSYHKLGKKVDEQVNNARKILQKFFNAKKPQEIIFTRNTTESINLIANSLDLKEGDTVLSSDKEHNSNLVPWQMLVKKGIKHEIFEFGNIEDFKSKLNPNVKLIATLQTSNLDGTSQPISEMIKLAHSNGSLVLLDGAQSAPHRAIDVQKLDVDFFACSGHKMMGPSGIGMLYGKYHLLEQIKPFIVGGETIEESTYETCTFLKPPEKFEAGLQHYAGIIGFGEAIKYLSKIGMENIRKHEIGLNKRLTEALGDKVDIVGHKEPEKRGSIFSFNIKGMDPHEVAIILDNSLDIAVRSGAHCCHSWFNKHNMKGSVRISLFAYNTKEDIEKAITAIENIISLA